MQVRVLTQLLGRVKISYYCRDAIKYTRTRHPVLFCLFITYTPSWIPAFTTGMARNAENGSEWCRNRAL